MALWRTVCDDNFSMGSADVVCRILSYREGALAFVGNAAFGQGTGVIWLDDLNCSGAESRLEDCPSRPIGQQDCSHKEDVGVACKSKSLKKWVWLGK